MHTTYTAARTLTAVFAEPASTPAGERTYDLLRLRCDKLSQPDAKRPGSNFTVTDPAVGVSKSRGAFEIPVKEGEEGTVAVTISYDA